MESTYRQKIIFLDDELLRSSIKKFRLQERNGKWVIQGYRDNLYNPMYGDMPILGNYFGFDTPDLAKQALEEWKIPPRTINLYDN